MQQRLRALPVGLRIETGEFNGSSQSQPGPHRRGEPFALRIEQRNAWHRCVRFEGHVIATLGIERHPCAKLCRQRPRIGTSSHHDRVNGDGAQIGVHLGYAPITNAKAARIGQHGRAGDTIAPGGARASRADGLRQSLAEGQGVKAMSLIRQMQQVRDLGRQGRIKLTHARAAQGLDPYATLGTQTPALRVGLKRGRGPVGSRPAIAANQSQCPGPLRERQPCVPGRAQ